MGLPSSFSSHDLVVSCGLFCFDLLLSFFFFFFVLIFYKKQRWPHRQRSQYHRKRHGDHCRVSDRWCGPPCPHCWCHRLRCVLKKGQEDRECGQGQIQSHLPVSYFSTLAAASHEIIIIFSLSLLSFLSYTSQNTDEIELKVDDVIVLHESFGDGWASGYNERSRKTGVFPYDYVSEVESLRMMLMIRPATVAYNRISRALGAPANKPPNTVPLRPPSAALPPIPHAPTTPRPTQPSPAAGHY